MSHPVNDEILDRLREEGILGYTGEVLENIFGCDFINYQRRTMKENHKMKKLMGSYEQSKNRKISSV